jgi:hypothetical protein
LVGGKYLKSLAKLCKANKKVRRGCYYAIGWVGAYLKMKALVSSKSKNWMKRKSITTIVGAFDVTTTKSTAAFNLGKQKPRPETHRSLKPLLKGICEGDKEPSIYGGSYGFANCAEFLAANELLKGGAKLLAIRWTSAYGINDRTGSSPSLGKRKAYCPNCVGMFKLRNKN